MRGPKGSPTPFPTRRARSLFCYLALYQGRFFERDVLTGVFWPDQDEPTARKGLRTALWRIRRSLEKAGGEAGEILLTEGSQVGIRASAPLRVDAREFEEHVRPLEDPDPRVAPEEAQKLAAAVELYRGDLAEGIYDDWCTLERRRLRMLFLRALERLVLHHIQRGEWLSALGRGHQLLQHDPLREHVHRQVMSCHYRIGDRPSAIRQFQRCADVLQSELGLEPMAETLSLRREILEGRAPDTVREGSQPPPDPAPVGSASGRAGLTWTRTASARSPTSSA